jgi:hypothetical protein
MPKSMLEWTDEYVILKFGAPIIPFPFLLGLRMGPDRAWRDRAASLEGSDAALQGLPFC